jgi:single-strand DNA-binding protein
MLAELRQQIFVRFHPWAIPTAQKFSKQQKHYLGAITNAEMESNMYQNRVFLVGFTGQKPEIHMTRNQHNCTVFSLATNSSYKDQHSGEYVKRTEWHRIIAWGKLGNYAASLGKGTHLLVEGELRSHEHSDAKNKNIKKRHWEIRADAIRKLDRGDRTPLPSQKAPPAKSERF